MIEQEKLKHLFEYKNGVLYWKRKTSPFSNSKIGTAVGSLKHTGYLDVKLYGKHYRVHRLIYLYHHGSLPTLLDHKDGNPVNNRIENLRECTTSQNQCNAKINSLNTSGFKGVVWNKASKKWQAQVKKDGIYTYLGLFDMIGDAVKTVAKARRKLHGRFARPS